MSLPSPYYCDELVTIYNADCRDLISILGDFDLLLTDPPYGILNLQGSGSSPCVRKSKRQVGSGKLKGRMLNNADVKWDVAPSAQLLDAARNTSMLQIVWGGNYFQLPPSRGILVWDKCQPWANFSQVELAWTNLERPAAIYKFDKSMVDDKVHPTQKPTALIRWCIGLAGEKSKTILDPWAGSCTTGVAAKLEGRKATLIEVCEEYCEKGARRMEQGVLF